MSAAPFAVVVSQRNFDAESAAFLHSHACKLSAVPLPDRATSDADLDEDTLAAGLAHADAWIVGHAWVTRTLLERLPRLKVICRRGVGYERVDVHAVRALEKVATIAVGGNDAAVADHTLGLMLAVGRRHRECHTRLARGDRSIPIGTDLYRKTVGIVGFGRIGRAVAARLLGFDCRILVYSPGLTGRAHLSAEVEAASLERVVAQSDYLTLHLPLTAQTRFLIDAQTLARMKPSAVLINTARGGLVDDAALLDALQEGRLAGAGLDVFMSESDVSFQPITDALIRHPSVVATSHSAGSTVESLQRTNLVAAQCAVAVLHGTPIDPACVVADGRRGVATARAK